MVYPRKNATDWTIDKIRFLIDQEDCDRTNSSSVGDCFRKYWNSWYLSARYQLLLIKGACTEIEEPNWFSNPHFRFLISFAGQYLAYNICISSPSCDRDAKSTDHQLLKIYVPQIDASLFGPGFIEVRSVFDLFLPLRSCR